MKQAMEQGVEFPGIGRTRHGGADPKKRGILNMPSQSVSVMQHNAYVEELKKHTIGYVTFLGTETRLPGGGTSLEMVHQYGSANGEVRMLQRFISEPVYFDADWNQFLEQAKRRNPIFLVSAEPLDPARLERRAELGNRSISFEELVNIARTLQIENPAKMIRDDLVEAILDVEFRQK